MLYLILLAFCELVWARSYKELLGKWKSEVEFSLAANIWGCQGRAVNANMTIELHHPSVADGFDVFYKYPTHTSVDQFSRNKPQMTKSNAAIIKIGEEFHKITKKNYATSNAHFFYYPEDSPAQNKANCYRIYREAAKPQPISIYDRYFPIDRAFYLLRAENAVVYYSGQIGTSCGMFIGKDGCESTWDSIAQCHSRCLEDLASRRLRWTDLWTPDKIPKRYRSMIMSKCSCPGVPTMKDYRAALHSVDKVFVVTAKWDFNYYHVLVDVLPRLAHYVMYLQQHPDVYIHFYGSEHYDDTFVHTPSQAALMRQRLLDLLGINASRVLHDTTLARVVFVPRMMRCFHAASNPLEIRLLAKHLLQGSYDWLYRHQTRLLPALRPAFEERAHFSVEKIMQYTGQQRFIVVIRRDGEVERNWSGEFLQELVYQVTLAFPQHKIFVLDSDSQKQPDYCLACDIFLFSLADVVIGEHGAGLTNVIFMQPGGVLVELVGQLDDRHFPYCGYYNALAGGLGIHHYIHAYHQQQGVDFAGLAGAVREFYVNMTMYAQGQWRWFHSV